MFESICINFWISDNHPQKLWHKPPPPSFNVNILSFRPARCTRQSSDQFQKIVTLSQHSIGGMGGAINIFFKVKRGCTTIFCDWLSEFLKTQMHISGVWKTSGIRFWYHRDCITM